MSAVRRLLLPVLLVLALPLGGCGTETAPSAAVPELADRLEAVDAAVVAQEPPRIRRAVKLLIATAEDGEESGELDAGQVESIVAAAETLLAELPAEVDQPAPSPTTSSPTPPSSPTPSPKDEEKEEDEDDEEKGKPGKGKGRDKKDD